MKTLNVQKITFEELLEKWGTCAHVSFRSGQELFIRSNAKGIVNWDKAPVYTWSEMLKEQKRRRVIYTVDPKIF